jgi:hypothetical protein
MRKLIEVFIRKTMFTRLYTPNGILWTIHSKYKSHKDAVNTLKLLRSGYYRHVMLLTLKDDGRVWYSINVVDNKQ